MRTGVVPGASLRTDRARAGPRQRRKAGLRRRGGRVPRRRRRAGRGRVRRDGGGAGGGGGRTDCASSSSSSSGPLRAVLPVRPMVRDGATYPHCRFPEAFTRAWVPVNRPGAIGGTSSGTINGPAIPEADRKRIGTPEIWFRKRRHWSDRSMHKAHRPTRGACRIRPAGYRRQ
ncbi:serine/arginine rich protein [Streptomyces lividans TK24]|nr:serine/arginine rich protein [Streptomyces lividans TK24]